MARKVQKKLDKWKSKNWYNIEPPEFLSSSYIGVTPAENTKDLLGRVVETTVGQLTNDITKEKTKLRLQIDNVVGDSAKTRFIGHEITTDYLRSIVKRQTSRIDNNVVVTTNDGNKVRVKPICFTVKRAHSSQIKAIRKVMKDVVKTRASEVDYEQFIDEAISGKLAANIYRNTKKVYPIRRAEIRKTEIQAEPITA